MWSNNSLFTAPLRSFYYFPDIHSGSANKALHKIIKPNHKNCKYSQAILPAAEKDIISLIPL